MANSKRRKTGYAPPLVFQLSMDARSVFCTSIDSGLSRDLSLDTLIEMPIGDWDPELL
ncbi:MAG: hypothetical protein K5652_01260 [Bacteroidales bacterium]|nr:hypothetical protein [Bacteroidales bacterium]